MYAMIPTWKSLEWDSLSSKVYALVDVEAGGQAPEPEHELEPEPGPITSGHTLSLQFLFAGIVI